jgi:hypothetical protein
VLRRVSQNNIPAENTYLLRRNMGVKVCTVDEQRRKNIPPSSLSISFAHSYHPFIQFPLPPFFFSPYFILLRFSIYISSLSFIFYEYSFLTLSIAHNLLLTYVGTVVPYTSTTYQLVGSHRGHCGIVS